MMTSTSNSKLETLVEDIYDTLQNPDKYDWDSGAEKIGAAIAATLKYRFGKDRPDQAKALRLSNTGVNCNRKLWYQHNQSEEAEPLQPNTLLKFLYGDIIEELVLGLAELTNHDVKGRQDTLDIEGVKGHRDCVIDGVTVDVKSANSRGMGKFKNHELEKDDPFGYLDQVSAYAYAATDEGLDKSKVAFLAVDKELGHLVLDVYPIKPLDYSALVNDQKRIVAQDKPPQRRFGPVPDGKSGNEKLGLECSYCPFKSTCWPNMKTYLYSTGPRYLTTVQREPDVPELRKDGTVVKNGTF